MDIQIQFAENVLLITCADTALIFIFSQYEEISSMGMLLTESQRKWVNFLKEAAKKKPAPMGLRPKVN